MTFECDQLDAFYEPQNNPNAANSNLSSITTRHKYFYIPSSKDGGENECVTRPGTFLRLGGYSDIEEEAATSLGDLSRYYPPAHLEHESGTNAYKNAAGAQAADSSGILLACDGRILVRADEHIHIYATELITIHAGDRIRQVTDDGPIHHHSACEYGVTASGKISLISGRAPDDPPPAPSAHNTAGDEGIEIIAKNGTRDIYLEANSLKKNLLGNETEIIEGARRTLVRANSYNDTEGNTTQIFRGAGLTLALSMTATFALSNVLSFIPGILIDVKIAEFELMDLKVTVNRNRVAITTGAKTEANATVTELNALRTEVATIRNEASTVAAVVAQNMVKNAAVQSEIGTMKSSIMAATNVQL